MESDGGRSSRGGRRGRRKNREELIEIDLSKEVRRTAGACSRGGTRSAAEDHMAEDRRCSV